MIPYNPYPSSLTATSQHVAEYTPPSVESQTQLGISTHSLFDPSFMVPYSDPNASPEPLSLSKGLQEFLQKSRVANDATGNVSPQSTQQVDWDTFGQWMKSVFGAQCEIGYQETVLGDGVVEMVYHLVDAIAVVEGGEDPDGDEPDADDGAGDVILRVKIHTRLASSTSPTDCGKTVPEFDLEASSQAALRDLVSKLKDVVFPLGQDDEHIYDLWSPTSLTEHTQYAVQYASNIPEGQFLLVAGNTMIDIRGGPSSAVLEPYIRSILDRSTVERSSLGSRTSIPTTIECLSIASEMDGSARRGVTSIKGLHASFELRCRMDGLIAAASADAEDGGLLVKKVTIEDDEDTKTSTVRITLVTRAFGRSEVDLKFGAARTMIMGGEKVQVVVFDA